MRAVSHGMPDGRARYRQDHPARPVHMRIERAPGQLVTFSACSQRLAGAEAFLPVLDGLDELTRAGEDAAITRLLRLTAPTWYVQIAPLWSTADPGFASVLEHARAASPERLKRELATFVTHITAVLPLVIAIDDLHWADASTVEVLAYLLSRPDLKRLLIVCAYRQTEMALSAHPFVSVRHELIKRRILVELPLRRLNREETARYLDLCSRTTGSRGSLPTLSRLEATAIRCSSARSLAT